MCKVKSIKPKLKIYGERNTGTNYLSELIRLNLDVDLLSGVAPNYVQIIQKFLPGNEVIRDLYFYLTFHKNLGWKHSLVKSPDKLKHYKITYSGLVFITITKNPYSWLLSLYDKPYHQYYKKRPTFEEFLTTRWITVGRENAPAEFLNAIELWNRKNASYITLKKSFPLLQLRYEDLLSDAEGTIASIAKTCLIDMKACDFKNYEKSTKESEKNFTYYQRYYLEEKWKEKLSARSIEIINDNLDHNLLKIYNYAKLTSL